MPEKIEITVVVNGQPTDVSAQPSASVESVIEPALRQTGNAGQPPANWELRTQAGGAVPAASKVKEYVGQTLFLNLRAGIGG
jgi:hypothetical protein